MTSPARILLRLDIGGGEPERQRFEAAWQRLAHAASQVAGHLGDTLAREVETPGRYWISTDWADLVDFQRFSQSSAHDEFGTVLRALVTDRSVRRTELVATVGSGPSR